jgi:hypothetical protein
MKIIISQDQIDKMKSIIDKVGIESLGIDSYRLVEMGFIQKYDGSLNLRDTPIKSLGNLEYVGKTLVLINTNVSDLGNLEYVGISLDLFNTNVSDFGNLKYIGGNLYIKNSPIDKLSDEEIRSQVEIKGKIYRD